MYNIRGINVQEMNVRRMYRIIEQNGKKILNYHTLGYFLNEEQLRDDEPITIREINDLLIDKTITDCILKIHVDPFLCQVSYEQICDIFKVFLDEMSLVDRSITIVI